MLSAHEGRAVSAFNQLLQGFVQQAALPYRSLPDTLSEGQRYAGVAGLVNGLESLSGDFTVHLVLGHQVVALYRWGTQYDYFHNQLAWVTGLQDLNQLREVVEQGFGAAGYRVTEGLLAERF